MKGDLKIYTGPMFAGKTTRMIEELETYDNFMALKPNMDDRYSEVDIVSHNGHEIPASSVPSDELLLYVVEDVDYGDISAVGIDEVQFFEESVVDAVDYILSKDVDVIAAGLDTDFRKEPFGSVPELREMADEYEKLSARCEECGDEAGYTQRIIDGEPASYDSPQVLIGADETYEPRCEEHHVVGKPEESAYDEIVSDIAN